MKTLLCLFCLIAITGTALAQDVIVLNDTGEIKAVVLSASRKNVAYIEWSDTTGTVYTKPTAEVQSIVYQNGKTKTFASRGTNPLGYRPDGPYMNYQFDIAVGYTYFLNQYSDSEIQANMQVETVHGLRINPYIFTGLGMGYTVYYKDEKNGTGILTFYANASFYYFLHEKFSFFLSSDIGFARNPYALNPKNRLYFACGPGIRVGRFIPWSFSIRYQYLGKQMNAIQLRLGIGF